MLREIQAVRQDRPGLKRRWFQDEFFDLYTWHTRWGTLAGFQLCYDVRGRERALTWHRKSGFSHNRIDHGDDYAGQPATPLLVADGRFQHRRVRERFSSAAATLEPAMRKFIFDKMREYGRSCARGEIALPRRHRAPKYAPDPS